MPVARTLALASLLVLAASAPGQGEKPTRVEIGKRGKAAMAFVEVPGRGTGTAFCVHPSGLFVTNEHVVRGEEMAEVTLVLNPSLPDERVLKARVVRVDKDADLALLRVEGAKDLPSLPLGSVKGVAELADVVACGFPLGKALSTDKKDYPAISVNAGSVTALRYKDRELDYLQIDVAVNYGNSGGPVLDDNGRVIGVVVASLAGAKSINKAIPVSHLERFLKAPDVSLSPPKLTPATLDKPAEFRARVASFVPDAPKPTLKLILRAGDEEPREYPMKKQDGAWVATAPPAGKTASRVEVSARLGSGMVTGTTDDAVFKVGEKPLRLSGVRTIEFGPKPSVVLADGRTTVAGAITGLAVVEIDVGGQKLKLDLSKATRVSVQAAPEVVSVSATVVASVGGKEVARAESRLPVGGDARPPADPSAVVIKSPALAEDKVVKRLPEAFDQVVVGGGGRYLIFRLPRLKKLAVFDVNEARVTKYIPLAEEDAPFAAGLDAVIVGLKKAGKLERWSLTTFELEKTVLSPIKDEIQGIVMGHASSDSVAVNGQFLDPETFRPLGVSTAKGGWGGGTRPAASADGTVFGLWGMYSVLYVLEGGALRRYEEGGLGHAIPGPDGRSVYTAKGVVTRYLTRADPDDASYGYCVPAVRGDYFLSITPAPPPNGKGGFTVYLRGLKQRVGTLDADHGLFHDGGGGDAYAMWSRVFFVPDAKLIILLSPGKDQLVLYKFDPDAALEKSGLDYLLVTSVAPREVKAGGTLTYPVKVKSKQGGVTFKLDSGPKGMAVSDAGVVAWAVPADATGEQDVILTVRDKSGQEVFHTFAVKVVK